MASTTAALPAALADWPPARRREYFVRAERLVDRLPETTADLRAAFPARLPGKALAPACHYTALACSTHAPRAPSSCESCPWF
jgi:hypothetical protein